LQIFLFTDGETPIDDTCVSKIANMINASDIRVNVIAINFFNETDQDSEDTVNDINQIIKESENQKATKKVLKNLISLSSNVKVFTAKMASAIYKKFRKKRIKPYVKYRGPLYISDNLYLDVNVFSKTVKSEIPSLKKFSKNTEYSKFIFFFNLIMIIVYYD
jgi:hypothetical protein